MLSGCWTEENRAALEELIARPYHVPPIAIFDWDNTCIRGDIADAAFHQLCRDLALRFDAPGFWDWVTEAHPRNLIGEAYVEYCTRPTTDNRLRLQLRLEQMRKALYEGEDDASICAWDAGAFVGWTLDEVHAYARQVMAQELQQPFAIETLQLDGDKIEIPRGLRIREELRQLAGRMQRAGWQVWVISASSQWLVEPLAELYGIPPARVVGMRREVVDGKLTARVEPPVSFSDGKLDAYQMFVSRTQPLTFAVGDSVNDWKILEWAEARLLVEPGPPKLREFALWRKGAGECWLLQAFE
jgi:phosphoserine phosphatase